jgi:hypothetical protein
MVPTAPGTDTTPTSGGTFAAQKRDEPRKGAAEMVA